MIKWITVKLFGNKWNKYLVPLYERKQTGYARKIYGKLLKCSCVKVSMHFEVGHEDNCNGLKQ